MLDICDTSEDVTLTERNNASVKVRGIKILPRSFRGYSYCCFIIIDVAVDIVGD